MPRRIAIRHAKAFAEATGCRQVIVAAWDGARTHIVTYGQSVEDCAQAAQGGNRIKDALGWPTHLRQEPARVQQLLRRIAALEAQLQAQDGRGETP